ncbi:MAG: class F sortase [Dermatophilaceae bacterium]
MTRPGLRRVVAVLAATLLGGGTAYAAVQPMWPSRYADPAGADAPASPGTTVPQTARPPAPQLPSPTVVPSSAAELPPPTRLVIQRLGITMAIVAVGVDAGGAMALPEDPAVVGWYQFGAAPAAGQGATVLAAHVDSAARGIGPLARLTAARLGDDIIVSTGDAGQWRYRVENLQRQAKTAVDYAQVFSRGGPPRLHLVTCTGRYERGRGYEDNLVLIASRVDGA